ncbi:MAG: Mu-like prophage major head subunit gpT family protein [Roseovarius sp.]|nr:MAG: hypothetical protein F9K50_08315 [bacterium]MBZ0123216.1 Mu-like prophage major head subunit gpT family protein [Roseovarius sp.]
MINRQITPDTFFEDALPMLEELYYSTYGQYPDMIPVLANYKPATGWGKQTSEQTGVGFASMIPEGASVPYDDIAQGNKKTFTFVKWGIGVKVTEEMIEDDEWDQVSDIYRSMGASMHHTRQQIFFDNFNNGFTAAGYDGVPLFSTSHPLVKAGGVQANKPAVDADLSVASLRNAITTVADWLTHEGLKTYFMPYCLLVSTSGIYDARELLKSDYKPGTADNNINSLLDYNIDPKMSPYLTDPDAWFLLCREHKLMFYDRKPPQMKSQEDFDAGSLKSKVTSRFDTGHGSWYGLYGSSGLN